MTEACLQEKEWSQIVARAWADESFRDRLLSDPTTVLLEEGFDLPTGVEVRIHDESEAGPFTDGDGARHFILPASPAGELSEEELGSGPSFYCYSWRCRCRRCRCGRCGCGCDRA